MLCWFLRTGSTGYLRPPAVVAGLCHKHANLHDELTLVKTDTSTGYSTYLNVYGALKCAECRLEWKSFTPRG